MKNMVWIVDYAFASGLVHSRLFVTEQDAQRFYDSIADLAPYRRIAQTEDIWHWTERNTKASK